MYLSKIAMKRTGATVAVMFSLLISSAFLASLIPEAGARPGDAAVVSLGGRLYDNHWAVLGQQPPSSWNPLFPEGVKVAPSESWRCVSCHGWDYRGANGHLGKVSKSPNLKSLKGVAGQDPKRIFARLQSGSHGRITAPIPPNLLLVLAKFLSEGQHEMADFVDAGGQGKGDPMRGKDIFEGTCQRCHGDDGTAPIYGERGDKSSLGWIVRNRPEQALHKIRNGVPLADMLSLRFLDAESLAGLVAYLQRLDASKQ